MSDNNSFTSHFVELRSRLIKSLIFIFVIFVVSYTLADQIYWTQSPHILGADSMPAIGALELLALPIQNNYTQINECMIGQDQLRIFVKSFFN